MTMTARDAIADESEPAPVHTPVGIVCGGGSLPYAVAEAVLRRGGSVCLLAIRGWADPAAVTRFPHEWISLGQSQRLMHLARKAGCRDLVCVGNLVRPALTSLRLDWGTLLLLPRLYRLFRGGDDHLLSGIGKIFEEHGFRLLGAHEVAPEILAGEGPLGRQGPAPRDMQDAAFGFSVIEAIGQFDIGQAVVVADRRVLAVEAVEGTDAMLARVAELRRTGLIAIPAGRGLLVKAPKPSQDRRLDLPTIGPATLRGAVQAGLAGVAVRAGGVIVAEAESMVAEADRAGVFVVGVSATRDAGA